MGVASAGLNPEPSRVEFTELVLDLGEITVGAEANGHFDLRVDPFFEPVFAEFETLTVVGSPGTFEVCASSMRVGWSGTLCMTGHGSAPGHHLAFVLARTVRPEPTCPREDLAVVRVLVRPPRARIVEVRRDLGVVPGAAETELTIANDGPPVTLRLWTVHAGITVDPNPIDLAAAGGPGDEAVVTVFVEAAGQAVDAIVELQANGVVVDSLRVTANLSDPASPDEDGDGFSVDDGDCDDVDPAVYPGATEFEDGVDQDCDGRVDEAWVDRDEDGVTEARGDCDDRDPWVAPWLPDVGDRIDNDCDGEFEEDAPVVADLRCLDGAACGYASSRSGPAGWFAGVALIAAALRRRRPNLPGEPAKAARLARCVEAYGSAVSVGLFDRPPPSGKSP